MNLLCEIIEKILKEQWCFNYNGACSTCGMMDVKNELKKYTFQDILNAFETLDFDNDLLCEKYKIELAKIYSLITGIYTVYPDRYDFKIFEQKIREKYPDNYIVNRLIKSNYKTYWDKSR